MQEASRFLDEIPADLLSGMVNRQSRRQAAYDRATTWGDDDDDGNRDSRRPNRQSAQRNPYNWSSQSGADGKSRRDGKTNDTPKQTYWSPDAEQPITRPRHALKSTIDNRQSKIVHLNSTVATVSNIPNLASAP
ncbi:MAG: hypothetical protein R3E79_34045 [Caldilineaceae bacterium]